MVCWLNQVFSFGFSSVYFRVKGKSDHVEVAAKTDIIAFDCRHAGLHLYPNFPEASLIECTTDSTFIVKREAWLRVMWSYSIITNKFSIGENQENITFSG